MSDPPTLRPPATTDPPTLRPPATTDPPTLRPPEMSDPHALDTPTRDAAAEPRVEDGAAADRSVAAALAGSAAASAVVPEGERSAASLAWRWVVGTDTLDLHATASTDWRVTCLGAGGALHRARVALAAEGLAAQVTLLPDAAGSDRRRAALPEESGHLARLVTTGSIEVTPEARELYDATDPDLPVGVDDPPAPAPRERTRADRLHARAVMRDLVATARAEGVRLRIVADGAELAAVLHGPDTREAWLRAGAALSAVRLAARRHGLATVVATESARPSWRRVTDREGWLAVGIGTPYARLRLIPTHR